MIITSCIQKNIIANFFKIIVLFSNQILLVPAYIYYLGIELYSDWIVISAIASFFTMSDVGISSVSNNMFTICYNKKDLNDCNKILCNNLLFTCSVLLIAIIAILVATPFINLQSVLNLHCITNLEAGIICAMLVFQILLIMGGNVFDSIYNASHLAHKVIYINNIAKLTSALFVFIGLFCNLTLCKIVALSVIPYIVVDAYKIKKSRDIFCYKLSKKYLDLNYLKDIVKPSLGFMFFPAGNAILYQGLTLIVNSCLGAQLLVLFNTTRTMTNFIRNIVQAVSSGIKPEFSIAYAHEDVILMKQLYRKSIVYSLIFAIMAIIALLIFGDVIYTVWTRNTIEYDFCLVVIFCATLFVNSIWEASCITMTSTNRHFRFSLIYVLSTVIAVLIAYCSVQYFFSLYSIALSIIVVDVIMTLSALIMSNKIINCFEK